MKKNNLEKKILLKLEVLKNQAKVTQEIANDLQKVKTTLSEFEKSTGNKSKSTLKTISKQ
jgi:hypothetical protein